MWDLPRPGLEPVSPALAGRFSTTAPPGKPLQYFFKSEKGLQADHAILDIQKGTYQTVCVSMGVLNKCNTPFKILYVIPKFNFLYSATDKKQTLKFVRKQSTNFILI